MNDLNGVIIIKGKLSMNLSGQQSENKEKRTKTEAFRTPLEEEFSLCCSR